MAKDIMQWFAENRATNSLLLDSIFDGVYIVTPERHIVYWNKASEELTGFCKDEVIGKWCGDNILVHIDENGVQLCNTACPLLKALKTGENLKAKVYPKDKDGRRFPTETHIGVIRNDENDIIGAIEVFRDISSSEEFRILQEKFNALIKRYVSYATYDDIQNRIRSTNSLNEPRILDLSVLYLDVVDFTGFGERTNPDEVVKMLNSLFGICEVITTENYGDIDKFIGDAMMAVFADANDAVNTAITILTKGLPSMELIKGENGKQRISVRIGINSGPVLQGDIGSLERKDLTVIGDTVNTAARIEKIAPHNQVLISEATLLRLNEENRKRFREYEEIIVRGRTEPVKLHVMYAD
jgi:PAS domain S-box-containing protein